MTSLFSTHITLKLILTHEYQRGTGNIHSLDKFNHTKTQRNIHFHVRQDHQRS